MEKIKPDAEISLKQKWLARVWNEEQNFLYLSNSTTNQKKFKDWKPTQTGKFIMFSLRCPDVNKLKVLVQVNSIKKTKVLEEVKKGGDFKGAKGDYWRLSFANIGYYWYDAGKDVYFPLDSVPKMKEHPISE